MQGAREQLSERIREAARRRTRLAPRGSRHWWTEAAADAEPLDCAALDGALRLDAADLVATAPAGTSLADLDAQLGAAGVWLALDPPGPRTRTLGGALAAGGAGPLAAGYGPPRDQVLGLTFIAGNGTVVKTGGRVVKNVAGFDLAKLVVGGHGAFGVVVEVHLRLRARPAADRTGAWPVADAPAATRRLLAAGVGAASVEAVSPPLAAALGGPATWTVLIRSLGTAAGVDEELEAAAAVLGPATPTDAEPWARWRDAVGAWPVVLRVGADPARWGEAERLVAGLPDLLGVSVTAPRGTVRAGCARLEPATLARLRESCAARGWPVTLERADPATRAGAGLWGALPDGTRALAESLRRVFDPDGVFAVPLWADGRTRGQADR